MGIGFGVRCSNCFYQKEFLLGIGMHYPLFEECLERVHYKTRGKIKAVIGSQEVHRYSYEKDLIHCENCNNLYSRPMVTFTYGDNQTFTTSKRCSRCGSDGRIVEDYEEINGMRCSKCKEGNLSQSYHIMWD